MNPTIEQRVEELFSLYEQYGSEEYGEHVTQLQHAVQAAELAANAHHDPEVVLAALLHDVGHLYGDREGDHLRMDSFGVVDHEELGAQYLLRLGFSEHMALLVRSHVEAKRYLTARRAGYYEQLSAASKETLTFQGGPMTDQEADYFESRPEFPLMIAMREWDEAAKLPDKEVGSLQPYREMAVEVLSRISPSVSQAAPSDELPD